jgi:chorismate-pyruvate lyase
VTDILEAYFRERMVVVPLDQGTVGSATLPASQQAALAIDGDVLKREILLRGEISESCHLYASSVIALARLPEPIRVGLLERHTPIGHLLLEHRVATFKEIIECHREPAGPLAKWFAISDRAPLLSRTYVLSVEGQPLMMITEKFPEFGR